MSEDRVPLLTDRTAAKTPARKPPGPDMIVPIRGVEVLLDPKPTGRS